MDELDVESNQETVEETVPQPNEEEGKRRKEMKKTKRGRQEEKPWEIPGVDITDYFNYGFTEETWVAYCKKQREIRAAMKNRGASHSKHLEDRTRPFASSSDSSILFPRRPESSGRSKGHHRWTKRNTQKLSSPEEDRATHLFTSPDFAYTPHFYAFFPPGSSADAIRSKEEQVRSRDQVERGLGSSERVSEGQHGEREKRDRFKKALASSCNNNSETKDEGETTNKCKRKRKRARRKRGRKETAKSKTNGSLLVS